MKVQHTQQTQGTKPTRQKEPSFSADLGNPSLLGLVAALLTPSLPGSNVVAGGAVEESAKNLGPSGWFLVVHLGTRRPGEGHRVEGAMPVAPGSSARRGGAVPLGDVCFWPLVLLVLQAGLLVCAW